MKRHFVRHFILKLNILPRQARDKHRESTQKKRTVVRTEQLLRAADHHHQRREPRQQRWRGGNRAQQRVVDWQLACVVVQKRSVGCIIGSSFPSVCPERG